MQDGLLTLGILQGMADWFSQTTLPTVLEGNGSQQAYMGRAGCFISLPELVMCERMIAASGLRHIEGGLASLPLLVTCGRAAFRYVLKFVGVFVCFVFKEERHLSENGGII